MKNIKSLLADKLPALSAINRPARLLLLVVIIDGLSAGTWGLFFNFYFLESGFDRDFLGLISSTHSLAAMLLGIPLGILADRIGAKRAMLLGYSVATVAAIVQVTVVNPYVILGATFLGGASITLFFVSQAPFLLKLSKPENRTLLFSLSFALVMLASSLGSLIAGPLPNLFGTLFNLPAKSAAAYQIALWAGLIFGIILFIPLLLIREPSAAPPKKEDQPAPPKRPLRQTLAQPLIYKLALPELLLGFGAAILIPFLNLFFVDTFAVEDADLGLIFSLSALVTGISALLGPLLVKRLGSKIRVVIAAQATSVFFMALMGFSPLLSFSVTGFLVRGALMRMTIPLYNAFIMEQAREGEQATVNSVKEFVFQIGWVVGPYISGLVQVAYGFTPLFTATLILYACGISMTWFFFGRIKDKPVAQPVLQTP